MIEIHRVSTDDELTAVPAQNLYGSLGFRPIAPYRAVEFGDTLFYELNLGTPSV